MKGVFLYLYQTIYGAHEYLQGIEKRSRNKQGRQRFDVCNAFGYTLG